MNARPLAVAAALVILPALVVAQDKVRAGRATETREQAGTVAAPAPAARAQAPAVAKPAANVTPTEITLQREVFDYSEGGRRDPYKSLMNTSEIRPLLSDLRLTAVILDMSGRNSVAILRDVNSAVQYRVRVGQQLGRLRVAGIQQKAVQFTIEEFGFNRQETLPLASDSTKVRNP